MRVDRDDTGDFVSVVYGTSKQLARLKTGEVAIKRASHPAAHALTGLTADTKFDFKGIVNLPWCDRYFKIPVRNPHGNTPKLGTFQATIFHAVELAYRAAVSR